MVYHRMLGSSPGTHGEIRSSSTRQAIIEKVKKEINADRELLVRGDIISVVTDCLYYDFSSVSVRIIIGPKGDRILVTDDGNALDRIVSEGKRPYSGARLASAVAKRYGLTSRDGILLSPEISVSEIPSFVALVSNASSELALSLTNYAEPRVYRDIAKEFIDRLDDWFPGISTKKNANFLGASKKVHTFDIEAVYKDKTPLLIDEVRPRKVNSIVSANFDLSRREDINVSRWAIYDPAITKDIGPENLSLLASITHVVEIDAINKNMLVTLGMAA